jgi:hypothetical protein
MNRDSVLSVYSDARAEYTKQLCVFLVPAYFQFYVDLLEKAKKEMIHEPKRALWQFQNYLNEIHDWNMEKVANEIHIIQHNSGCDYLEDLLTAVFIAHTKVLTAIRLSTNHKKVEINVPKVEHFLFKVLCETSKLLWSSTYLFRDGIPGIEKQQNYRNIEGILHEGILQAVRSLVPVKSILKDFVNQDADSATMKDDEDSDNESEIPPPAKIEEVLAIPSQQSVPIEPPVTLPISEPAKIEEVAIAPLLLPVHSDIPTTTQPSTPVIVLDDKPTVRFGQFNTMFDSEHPNDSDMILEPKETDDLKTEQGSEKESGPVLHILEEDGVALDEEHDIETLDNIDGPAEALGEDDYEDL